MSEIEELEEKVRELISDYHALPQYKRYKILKDAIHDSNELQALLTQSVQMKNSARFLAKEEKEDVLKKAKELYDLYENDPLVVNYKAAKQELIDLLLPLLEAGF